MGPPYHPSMLHEKPDVGKRKKRRKKEKKKTRTFRSIPSKKKKSARLIMNSQVYTKKVKI